MRAAVIALMVAAALTPGCQDEKRPLATDGGPMTALTGRGSMTASAEQPTNGHFDSKSTAFDFASPSRRAAFLGRYLRLRSPVEDAQFVMEYHAGGGLAPGPSDIEIRALVKVSPSDLPAWTEGATAATSADFDPKPLMVFLLPADAGWPVASAPHVYRRGGTWIATYDEGYVVELVELH